MITVCLRMKLDQTPLKRVPVALCLDADGHCTAPVPTDREGRARFDLPAASGKVLVDGVERYHGQLAGEVQVDIWSSTQAPDDSQGLGGHLPRGSNAYPSMQTRTLEVDGQPVLTDAEGYLVDPATWSESFVRALAAAEGLRLADAHWELIRYLREHFARAGTQATVRNMVRHFSQAWGREAGSSAALHRLFPRGGPQKQGNRLAGLLRTKGEH
ncbi:TusE/DsrC/DsvC family sulfur relay protein [uncultured Thiodictyon sp.]|uniref:TusE/DsrC/DsvC family sulfur relay protein n=1 Tax=uncultured Thiodictyon sp. TaxID=1846217 RepID=UPI0025CBDD88|nr:TusE/DsrC/DsvC family sulfur relay protein [uncultured Thiodictyon sp.]